MSPKNPKGLLNRVKLYFDVPVCISYVRIWNYTKTPERGAYEYELLCDDAIIYRVSLINEQGYLRKGRPTCAVFSADSKLITSQVREQIFY